MLEAKNISVSAGEKRLLDDVSVTMEPGKVSVILGPNGAGKSTLLSCLAGLCAPDNGSIMLDGDVVTTMDGKQRARRIGLLPQSAHVHWDLESRDLVALGRYPFHGQSSKIQDDALIDTAMAATATTPFAGRNVLSLSGGERARVLLARVLAGQPEWLLADEPLANLDPRYQLQLLNQMRSLANEGTGVVAVLHDLTQAARIADHVILLSKGRVFAAGLPEVVLTANNLKAVYHVECAILFDDDGQIVIVPKV
jgi:iron complex transport system ATP-binding protein